jgi:tRNA(Ile)-lysidine synthase
MGPHPAVAAVRLAVRRALRNIPLERNVLVACSGGADSVALAAATAFECSRTSRVAGLVTIDHGLQPGSSGRAKAVAGLGYELCLNPVHAISVVVGEPSENGGPEAAARAARYRALEATRGSALVLLGHTADDQAETVLLGLGRGSGPRAIAGMRPVTHGYLRPFLGLRRADTVAACAALGLPVWNDPHNEDPRFRRVRLRREVLPMLEAVLAGGVTEALARTASQLQDDLDTLDELTERLLAEAKSTDGSLDVRLLAAQPAGLVSRVVKEWAERAGVRSLTAVHIGEITRLVLHGHGQGPLDLPGGFRVQRRSGTLALIASAAHPS